MHVGKGIPSSQGCLAPLIYGGLVGLVRLLLFAAKTLTEALGLGKPTIHALLKQPQLLLLLEEAVVEGELALHQGVPLLPGRCEGSLPRVRRWLGLVQDEHFISGEIDAAGPIKPRGHTDVPLVPDSLPTPILGVGAERARVGSQALHKGLAILYHFTQIRNASIGLTRGVDKARTYMM